MFRSSYDWVVYNRSRFGELSFTFALSFLWVMTVILILNVATFAGATIDVGAVVTQVTSVLPDHLAGYTPQLTSDAGMGTFFVVFLTTCVVAPLVEEMFRAALLQFACEDKATGEMKNHFVILAMSFIFFGLLHGGYIHIVIQGVLGLLLARLWFKVGRSSTWKYFSMVAVHGAYNFAMVCIDLMILRAIS